MNDRKLEKTGSAEKEKEKEDKDKLLRLTNDFLDPEDAETSSLRVLDSETVFSTQIELVKAPQKTPV
ncbi:unnamed protein product [Caenorhabditis angaria]|uniref:Uncharacterized protein n=1 Tax=Caenorhabditis angaria TaxID=860376 RepID=A0A9P1N4V5_9PELO|nr:unnamed protein product [Caenorhabditis angaria]